MDPEIYTLDEIRPTWFRRLVMIIISPFMLILMISCFLLFVFMMLMMMVAHPSMTRKTWNSFRLNIYNSLFRTIYYWHVDIWNGVTIRNA